MKNNFILAGLIAIGTMGCVSCDEALQDDSQTQTQVVTELMNEDAQLRINEVVAKDVSGALDWIEIYASGDSTVYLADYSIMDENSEAFVLPSVSLASGEFYKVYATTDEQNAIDTVGFKLGANDEVSLYKGNDLIDQLDWKKGDALIGQSYGRFPDGSDATYILNPTPMIANAIATNDTLVINEVFIDSNNSWIEFYNNSQTSVQLSDYSVMDNTEDLEPISLPEVVLAPYEFIVVYATNMDPNDDDLSLSLDSTDELSLIFNDETVGFMDWDDSDVISGFSYGLNPNDSQLWDTDFLTPTPGGQNQVASAFNNEEVDALFINISDANWSNILANPLDEQYHETSITLNGVTLDSVAIRTKGGSSLSSVAQSTSDRYSFKIDINEYVSGQKFFGLKKFTLQNSFNDPTYMREVIAYDLLDQMGVATPEHAYVNVYVNGELFGLYLMVEAIDGEFLENNFSNSNGDLYKPDGTGSDLLYIDDNISSYADINLQTNEGETDNGAFIHFVKQLTTGSTSVIDVDGLLRYMSVSVALSNLDSYHGTLAHNYYLYEQDGVFSLLPWDFNEAFGSFAMNCNGVDMTQLYIDEPVDGALADRPLVSNVFAIQSNLNTYHDYLWDLIEGPLASDAFASRIDAISNLIREHVENDPTAFYSVSNFDSNLHSTVDRFYGLTEFMTARVTNMKAQLNGTQDSKGDGSGFCGGDSGMPPPRF